MTPAEILWQIVVDVSRDGKTGNGTGFFVSDHEVATCYHVLNPDRGRLNEIYWIRHISDNRWKMVEPDNSRCDSINDYAILTSNEKIEFPRDLKFKTWDGSADFHSLGCGSDSDKISAKIESYTISGTIKGYLPFGDKQILRRLQLETEVETLQQGRSGSPVFCVLQNAIIGMIDFQAGQTSPSWEMPIAIPIEDLLPNKISFGKLQALDLPIHFIPRDEYLNLVKKVLLLDNSKAIVVIHGMGGIGKSVLAASVARDNDIGSHFKDGIFRLLIGTEPNLLVRQSDLASQLDNEHHTFKDVEQGRSYLSDLLANKTCLIILDDVWHADNVRVLFSDLGPGCRMLITTRDAQIVTALDARKIQLGLPSISEAKDLLANWMGKDLDAMPKEALEIVQECGRLPLALAICGALAKDGVPWNDLLDDLKESKLEFINHEYGSVMISMKTSVDRLPLKEGKCYRDLVVFSQDEPIPQAAIVDFWAYANELDKRRGRRLLVDLNHKSLIQKIENNGDACFELHPLQYDFLKVKCGNVLDLHRILLDAYKKRTNKGEWYTGPDDGYFFQYLPYHLLKAERETDLRDLLLNIKWLQTKLRVTDSHELISDYDLLKSKDDLILVQGAIRLSAHILARDPGQLQSQLLGRMMGFSSRPIQVLLGQIPENISDIWLCPMIPSLTAPGGPLIRTVKAHIDSVNAVAITPDGQKAVSGSSDNTLRIWDLETGKEIQILQGHIDSVNAVAITSDGQKAVSGSSDNTLRIWDLETGKEIQILQGHINSVNAVAITSDGQKAVSGSFDNTLRIWDMETGEEIKTLQGHTKSVNAVAITPDGQKAVSGSFDNTLRIWDMKTGEEIKTLQGHIDSVNAVAITPDGRNAVSGSSDRTLRVWDLESGRILQTLTRHTDSVNAVAIASDGQKVISGSEDKSLKIWNLETGRETHIPRGHIVNTVAITPDCQKAVSGSDDGCLKIWNLEKGQDFSTLLWHKGWVRALSVTPDGKNAISGYDDSTIKIWNLENGQELRTLSGHEDWVNVIVITPDGKKAVSGSSDTTAKVWDLETGKELQTLRGHTHYINALAITPDGQRAISASSDKTLKVWNLETGKELRTLRGHNDLINAVVITSDGKKAISGSDDGTLKIWDLQFGLEINTFQGHDSAIRALACDGKLVISVSKDNVFKVWDVEIGKELRSLRYPINSENALFICSDGKTAVSCSNNDILDVWELETGSIIAKFIGDEPMTSITVASDGITIIAGDGLGYIHSLRLENSGSRHTLNNLPKR